LATMPCWSEGARLGAYNCDPCGLNINRAMILQIGRFHRYSSAEAARELRWGAWAQSDNVSVDSSRRVPGLGQWRECLTVVRVRSGIIPRNARQSSAVSGIRCTIETYDF
jgi:hypothetical protein